MWDFITIIAGILAALGLWALLAGRFLDVMRRNKKSKEPREQ
jgi:hypothetical protein